ncbi:MAG: hypothetical protein HOY78_02700 [Saccharothrix sp.]|nr:hypothetical protein [Saccharothrix sp.]
MATTIRRNATRKIAAIKNAARTATRYSVGEAAMVPSTVEDAFSVLNAITSARLLDNGDGTFTVRVHSDTWFYVIDVRPTDEQAARMDHEVDYTNKAGHSGSILIERGNDRRNQAFRTASQTESSGTTIHGVYVVVPGFGRLPVERPAEVEQLAAKPVVHRRVRPAVLVCGTVENSQTNTTVHDKQVTCRWCLETMRAHAEPVTDEQTDLDALDELVDEIERTPINADGSVTLGPLSPASSPAVATVADSVDTEAVERLGRGKYAAHRAALLVIAAKTDAFRQGVVPAGSDRFHFDTGKMLAVWGLVTVHGVPHTGFKLTEHGKRVAALLAGADAIA